MHGDKEYKVVAGWNPATLATLVMNENEGEYQMVVVLFGTKISEGADLDEYETRSRRMNELVSQMPGFISFKSYASDDGDEVSVARFESEPDLDAWRRQPEHVETQRRARENFYESYWVQVCRTIRDYEFSQAGGYVHHPT